MIIVMDPSATEAQVADVVERLSRTGIRVLRLDGERVVLSTAGPAPGTESSPTTPVGTEAIADMPGVSATLNGDGATPMVAAPHATAAPEDEAWDPDNGAPTDAEERGFQVKDRWIGGAELFIAAGPCSVEDADTMDRTAAAVAAAGGAALRAGAFKPRSSPYSFQGMGETGLAIAHDAAAAHGLLLVSEVLDATQIPIAARYVDVLQVGARNMYNTSLLRELGRARRPVLLKRGLAATIDEWLSAAEYIVAAGNPRVILCERGIRTFETATRNTLDLNAIPVLRERTRLPVLVDPSHGTGRRVYVRPLARAAIACGADGLLVEAHPEPDRAASDAAQTVDLETMAQVVSEAEVMKRAIAR